MFRRCNFAILMELLYVFKKFWCQLPEDGEIIAPKHVGSRQNILSVNYNIVHLFVLQNLFNSLSKLNHSRIQKTVLKVTSIYLKSFEVFPNLFSFSPGGFISYVGSFLFI